MTLVLNTPFPYKALRGDAVCNLQLYRVGVQVYAVVSERPDNKRTSVRNNIEGVATAILMAYNLDPDQVVFVEHLPPRREGANEEFSRVTMTWNGATFTNPEWENLPPDVLEHLLGHPIAARCPYCMQTMEIGTGDLHVLGNGRYAHWQCWATATPPTDTNA